VCTIDVGQAGVTHWNNYGNMFHKIKILEFAVAINTSKCRICTPQIMPTGARFVSETNYMEKYELARDIVVMYVPASSFPEGIMPAFKNLEQTLGNNNDRTFFGISWGDENGGIVYKAAAEQKYDGESKKYNLDTFTIKKGTYISELIQGYQKDVSLIGTTFHQLLSHPELDENGYCLEWYKGPNDVLCLVKLESFTGTEKSD